MPERPLPIGTYVVGASLCAISLFYVFGPSFVFDGDASMSKRRIVGLDNPANMCFCNSVLQALANSPGLRKYLIREIHRRKLDGPEVYKAVAEELEDAEKKSDLALHKVESLQQGIVTFGLKQMLDKLNERPLQRKTITATEFILCLETAFRTRISRQQQDAQEFLQIVLERLCEEYHAGRKARRKFKKRQNTGLSISNLSINNEKASTISDTVTGKADNKQEDKEEEEAWDSADRFPFEGQTEAQIECTTCHFKPKPSVSNFVTLTLNVPQKSTANLNQCFDGIFREETIEDFRCDKCRLTYAKQLKESLLTTATASTQKDSLLADLALINKALAEDPERDLQDAHLPKTPKRTIKRSMRISHFPRVLAIHLSRSIYSSANMSTKNMAKITFPETLALGGLTDPHSFRLSSVVTHKGGHNSGHYETFRRQSTVLPFSTPHSFGTIGPYSREASPNPSALTIDPTNAAPSPTISHSSSLSDPSRSTSTRSSLSAHSSLSKHHPGGQPQPRPPTSAPRPDSMVTISERSTSRVSQVPTEAEVAKVVKKQKKAAQRWWRVSDDRVKESKTSEVLHMQREVYLLFYEAEDIA